MSENITLSKRILHPTSESSQDPILDEKIQLLESLQLLLDWENLGSPNLEYWTRHSGLHNIPDFYSTEKRNGVVLSGKEKIIADTIQHFLKRKEPGETLLVVDIDGGLGLSWIRLARYFRPQVLSGKLRFIVTNSQFDINTIPNPFQNLDGLAYDDEVAEFDRKYRRFWLQQKSLVEFIHTTPEDSLSHFGPAMIVHEGDFAHSTMQSLDSRSSREALLRALAPGGVLFWNDTLSPLPISSKLSPDLQQIREKLHTAFLNDVQKAGYLLFLYLTWGENPSYTQAFVRKLK